MKPTSNLHRLPATDSWQRQPQVKNALMQRIKSITSEIHSIQAEMHGQLNEPASESNWQGFLTMKMQSRRSMTSKAELDQLRRILWFYIEQASAQPAAAMNKEQQDKRLQRVNELLRTLAPPAAKSAIAGTNDPTLNFIFRAAGCCD